MSSYFLRIFRRYSSRPNLSAYLDRSVLEAIESGEYKHKHHAGIIKNKTVILPESVIERIRAVIKDHTLKTLTSDAIKLKQYLLSRHLPSEEEELKSKLEEASLFVEKKYNVSPDLTEEERQIIRKKYQRNIKNVFKQKTYSWKAIDYGDYQSKMYLVGRSPADFAVLCRVFYEINKRVPEFQPKTLFDFGSGVGSVMWAANNFWKDSLEEQFCVDSSAVMNDLACSILKEENETYLGPPKGVFFRQFLPVSHVLKYDIVVSAFTLFELPTLKTRLETILTLWKKTRHFLIIIEQGTNAGFQVVNEARDFILEYCNDSKNSSEHAAHVFAPCPHNEPCPRFTEDRTPCNFEVKYSNPFFSTSSTTWKEKFSYVILRKGLRPEQDPQWPRIVRPVLPRSHHAVCRMCTSAGRLKEIVFTASKHGKTAYKCARASNWGDLLPMNIQENPQPPAESEETTSISVNEKEV